MVYSYVESAAAAGIWTKTIRAKTGLHPKNVEKSLKHLETKGLIKPMKNVKNPGRKMYILSRLKPSEDATGGTWYTNDELDVALLDNVANAIEGYVSLHSWQKIDIPEHIEARVGQKRKAPSSGFDTKGKGKARATSMTIHEDDAPRPRKLKPKTEFRTHPPNHDGYPTVHDITKAMNDQRVVTTILPVNAISQLVEVMVLDDKLIKRHRPPIPGNIAEEQEAEESGINQVTMYRHLKKPDQTMHDYRRRNNAATGDMKAAREIELEDIGLGGSTEVPCLRCTVFDICEDGGPVNAKTCTYWDEFWSQMEKADKEAEVDVIYDIDEMGF
jgi:DNA-directed RNA polymerase III subunit RPC6